ncbi:MAG: TPR end-of-group domain-containing protein [Gaiellaceae bacterium]
MATTTFSTLSLEAAFAAAEGDRRNVRLRRDLGVQSFNINATRAVEGEELLREHDEVGYTADRHEKVWLVLSGHAVFTVDGEEIDAPGGTVVHVPVPEARRSAVARDPGTTLLGIGGRPGQPYRPTPGEALADFFPLHEAGDYDRAAAECLGVLEQYLGNGLALFNLACCEALLGRKEDALAHLRAALDAAAPLRENAKTDTDLDSLRDDQRFGVLVA